MKPKSILIIDDDLVDIYISKHVISKFKIIENIITKNSAVDALEYLSALTGDFPDIVLLDIRMPEMNGFEFLEKFEAFPEAKKKMCKIFMLTSSSDPSDMKKGNDNLYVKKYLNKPLSEEVFSDAIITNNLA